jgi:uncharacterized protein (TIGR04551 family)
MRRRTAQVLILISVVVPLAASAQSNGVIVETDEAVEDQPFLSFQNTGYLRFRSDMFYRTDLGNSVGGFLRPINLGAQNAQFAEQDNLSMSSNMRFRWRPELLIAQQLKVGVIVDVLDNIVLGSTPDFADGRPDTPLNFLSGSQMAVDDAVNVKSAWAEWNILNVAWLRVGRMPDHFGLGIAANDGDCFDCDFGDYTDRASVLFQVFGFHSMWFFDSPSEGVVNRSMVESFGQAPDLSSVDDVIRWGFTIGQKPITADDKARRLDDIGKGKVLFDWVFRNAFVEHNLSSNIPEVSAACDAAEDEEGLPDIYNPTYSTQQNYQCVNLLRRNVSLWLPDLWFKVFWRRDSELSVRWEVEMTGMYGSVERVQPTSDYESAKDFIGFGGVSQLEVEHRQFTYSFEFGWAMGDNVAFGPFGPGFSATDNTAYAQDDRLFDNRVVNRFLFDRDYHVDLLLYREIIGAVTNSVYFKPTFRMDFLRSSDLVLGSELSLIYAHALEAGATPGKTNPLGLETDLSFFYEMPNALRADLEMGVLAPFSALRSGPNGLAPLVAFTLQARITVHF